jgi:SAM-dependent methyltransferase
VTVFAGYANYYDLLYRDKDYSVEAEFVDRTLKRHGARIRTLLELGCGTGRHAIELARRGHVIHGVDLSSQMVVQARAAFRRLPAVLRDRLSIEEGNATAYSAPHKFDAVISLFHVVNYQLTHRALFRMFRAARRALSPGGFFLFDFWYGPGVLANPPELRVRRVSGPNVRLVRIAEPELDAKRSVVDVNFTLFAVDTGTARAREYREKHSMRFLFLPEIASLARETHFKIVGSGEWLTRKPLANSSWLGYAILRAVDNP